MTPRETGPAQSLSVLLLFLPALLQAANAQGLQSWNQVGVTLAASDSARLEIFGVARVRDRLRNAYDSRAGMKVSAPLGSRVTLEAGWLFRHVEPDGAGFHNQYRLFAGPNVVVTRRAVTLEWLTLYERHLHLPDQSDFNRYRQRFELERPRQGLSPFLMQEFTFLQDAFVRSRSWVGLRWRFGQESSLDFGYQFESLRRDSAWAPRHAIRTSLSLGRSVDRH